MRAVADDHGKPRRDAAASPQRGSGGTRPVRKPQVASLHALQRAAGNRAVGQLIASSQPQQSPVTQRAESEEDGGGGLLAGIRRRIGAAIGGVRSGWSRLADGAASVFTAVQNRLRDGTAALGRMGTSLVDGLRARLSAAQDLSRRLANRISGLASGAVAGLWNAAGGVKQALLRLDGPGLSAAWQRLIGLFGGASERVQAERTAATGELESAGTAARTSFATGTDGLQNQATALTQSVGAQAQQAEQGLGRQWQGISGQADSGLSGGSAPSLLRRIVERLLAGARQVWGGIQGQWQELRQRAGGVFARVTAGAAGLWQGLRDRAGVAWDGVRSGIGRAGSRLAETGSRIGGGIASAWQRIRGFSIGGVVDKISQYAPFVRTVQQAVSDPDAAMAPMVDDLSAPVAAGMPAKADELAEQHVARHAAAAAPGQVPVQRIPGGEAEERSVTPPGALLEAFKAAVGEKWAAFNLKATVKHVLYSAIWPWPAVGEELSGLLGDWKATVGSLFSVRSSGFLDGLHDLWTNVLQLVDLPLALWRRINNIGMLLMGWVTLGLTIAGAIGGTAVGSVLGAIAGALAGLGIGAAPGAAGGAGAGGLTGAGAGFGVAMSIGEALVVSMVAAEGTAIVVSMLKLLTGRLTLQEKLRDVSRVVDSLLSLAIIGLLAFAGWVGGRIAAWAAPIFRRIMPSGVLAALEKFAKGVRMVREKPPVPGKSGDGDAPKPPAAAVLDKVPLRGRLERLTELVSRSRAKLAEHPDADLEARLQSTERTTGELSRRLEAATTEEELRRISAETGQAERTAFDVEVSVGRVALRARLTSLRQRYTRAVERVGGLRTAAGNERVLRGRVAELERRLAEIDTRVRALEEQTGLADSQRRLDQLSQQIDEATRALDDVERNPMLGELGVTEAATEAIRVIEEKAFDPLGDRNSEAGHNHYDAARREARGDIVAAKSDGTPFDHIRDLQNGREAVANAQAALEAEIARPLPTLTERGLRVLLAKQALARSLLSRVDGFLNSIGWPSSRPHRWIQRGGRWVQEGDVTVLGPRLSERFGGVFESADRLRDGIGRVTDAQFRTELFAEREAIMREATAGRTRTGAATTEAELRTLTEQANQLRLRADRLTADVAAARALSRQ